MESENLDILVFLCHSTILTRSSYWSPVAWSMAFKVANCTSPQSTSGLRDLKSIALTRKFVQLKSLNTRAKRQRYRAEKTLSN